MASRIWVKPQHPYLPQLPPAVHDSQQMLTISVSLKGFCECSIATGQQASRTHWCKSTSLHDSQRTRISWRETKAEETREISSAFRAYDTLILELSIIYKCYLISATSALLGFCVSPHSQRLPTHTHGWEPNHCHGRWFWIKGVERASNPLYNTLSWWLKLMPQDLSIRSSPEYGNET